VCCFCLKNAFVIHKLTNRKNLVFCTTSRPELSEWISSISSASNISSSTSSSPSSDSERERKSKRFTRPLSCQSSPVDSNLNLPLLTDDTQTTLSSTDDQSDPSNPLPKSSPNSGSVSPASMSPVQSNIMKIQKLKIEKEQKNEKSPNRTKENLLK